MNFIKELRIQDGIEIVTNQLGTQLRGEFEAVTGAINHCMRKAMEAPNTVVLVVKYLNIDVELQTGTQPDATGKGLRAGLLPHKVRLNSGHDPVLDGILNQLRIGFDIKGFHNLIFMKSDGPWRDIQDYSDLFHGVPFSQ